MLRGKAALSRIKKSMGGDAERGVVMEASPASPFEVGEAEFALEFLIIAFDAPAQFRSIDENFDRCVLRQGREPVFRRLALALGPFDQQPFERMRGYEFPVSRGRPKSQALFGALAPGHVSPSLLRQRRRQRLGRDRPMLGVAPHARGLAPRPIQGLGGSGSLPAGQTVIVDCTPTA